MNYFSLYVTVFFLSISLLSQPSFSADIARGNDTISPRDQTLGHIGWSYKNIAIGGAVGTICLVSATISPPIGLCAMGTAAVLSALYYCRKTSPVIGELVCINTEDLTETSSIIPETEIVSASPAREEVLPSPMPMSRSNSFKDLNKPLKDLQLTILDGAIEGISASTIGSLAQIFAEKRTLNGIAVNYQRITENTDALYKELSEINTEDSIALKAELKNFFRHFQSDSIINKRIVIFLLITNTTISETEKQYFLCHQYYQALASYFSRLIIKFKDLETGKGVSAEGMGVLSTKTLKTEYERLSQYACELTKRHGISEEEFVKLAEISLQITHIDREDRLQKIFRHAKTLDDASCGILDALRQQSDKELTWHTAESNPGEDMAWQVFTLGGFYRVLPFKGKADASTILLSAHGVKYEKQPHMNRYTEKEATYYLRIWKDTNFLSEHLLDESNQAILQAIQEGKYILIAIAFGKDKSPRSTERGFYLFPTALDVPRLAQHDGVRGDAVIYRLYSRYNNNEEDLKVLEKLLLKYCRK